MMLVGIWKDSHPYNMFISLLYFFLVTRSSFEGHQDSRIEYLKHLDIRFRLEPRSLYYLFFLAGQDEVHT